MSEEEWLGWMREPWAVVPDPAIGGMWAIILKSDLNKPVSNALTPVYHEEEVARHICRAHNYYLSGLRHDGDFSREEMSDGRGSESKEP